MLVRLDCRAVALTNRRQNSQCRVVQRLGLEHAQKNLNLFLRYLVLLHIQVAKQLINDLNGIVRLLSIHVFQDDGHAVSDVDLVLGVPGHNEAKRLKAPCRKHVENLLVDKLPVEFSVFHGSSGCFLHGTGALLQNFHQ